jgi:hypothetical protein
MAELVILSFINAECHSCWVAFMLSVRYNPLILSVRYKPFMLSVIMLNGVMLNVIMLSCTRVLPVLLWMLVLLVAAAKVLAVIKGKYIDLAFFLYCPLYYPSLMLKWIFLQTNIEQSTFIIYLCTRSTSCKL